jgi:threonine dehydrogenase-like Zn-dependent dehydrogenase
MSAVEGLLERAVAGQGAVVAADLLAARPELTSTLITHRFPIEDAVEAFRLAQDKSKGVFRVVVEPS